MKYLNPELAARDCQKCLIDQYNEETGKPVLRDGKPVKRIPGHSDAPCRTKRGCPKGTPEEPNIHSEKNRKTYQIYEQAQGCKGLPEIYLNDEIVRQNLAMIHREEVSRREEKQDAKDIAKSQAEGSLASLLKNY